MSSSAGLEAKIRITRRAATAFGKAVRKARVDAELTLNTMASVLGVSSGYLSSIETGLKSVPPSVVAGIETLLRTRGLSIPQLGELADLSNGRVSLAGLSTLHAQLVAKLAHADLDPAGLLALEELLAASRNAPKDVGFGQSTYTRSAASNTTHAGA